MTQASIELETAEKKMRLRRCIEMLHRSLRKCTIALVRDRNPNLPASDPDFRVQVASERNQISRILRIEGKQPRNSMTREHFKRIVIAAKLENDRTTEEVVDDLINTIVNPSSDGVTAKISVPTLELVPGDVSEAVTNAHLIQENVHEFHYGRGYGMPEACDLVSDFVGREVEIARLLSAFRSPGGPRIGFIFGMPGIGKTQLALNVASKLESDFPDGQIFVCLQSSHGERRCLSEVFASGIRAINGPTVEIPHGEEFLARAYRHSLEGKRVLIIADNADNADYLRHLIPPRRCALLITSREKIPLPESAVFVESDLLSESDCISLLQQMSPRICDKAAKRISEYCGYLPLAIRSAGTLIAITDDLDPIDYATQLADESERICRIGSAGVPVGIEASFNLSYQRLSELEKMVFSKLSIFPLTFSSDAECVCCDDPDATVLSELFRRRLVFFSRKSGRYWLHDLIRLFALKHLNTNLEEKLRLYRRFADYFCRVLDSANREFAVETDEYKKGLIDFETERVNIIAAWRWVARGDDSSEEENSICSRFGLIAGLVSVRNIGRNEREELFGAAIKASQRISDKEAEVASVLGLARALYDSGENGRLKSALKILEKCSKLDVCNRTLASIEFQIGNVYMQLEPRQEKTALIAHERAVILARKADDVAFLARALARLAMTSFANFRIDRAESTFSEALKLVDIGFPRARLYVLNFIGQMETKLSRVGAALVAAEEALSIAIQFGELGAESAALVQLGRISRDEEPEKALSFFNRSLEINKQLGNLRREAGAHCDVGKCYKEMKKFQFALEAYERSLEISKEIGWDWNLRKCIELIDATYLAMSRGSNSSEA